MLGRIIDAGWTFSQLKLCAHMSGIHRTVPDALAKLSYGSQYNHSISNFFNDCQAFTTSISIARAKQPAQSERSPPSAAKLAGFFRMPDAPRAATLPRLLAEIAKRTKQLRIVHGHR